MSLPLQIIGIILSYELSFIGMSLFSSYDERALQINNIFLTELFCKMDIFQDNQY